MKRTMMTIAAAALMIAGFTGVAEAQHHSGGGFHGGGGFHSGGGFHGGGGSWHGGGGHGGFHGGGFRGGAFFGGPLSNPFWYDPYWDFAYPYYDSATYSPYPYYYPPYTDYGPNAPNAAPSQGWYYCSNPQGYYPSVPSCNTQWQFVPPRPPQPS